MSFSPNSASARREAMRQAQEAAEEDDSQQDSTDDSTGGGANEQTGSTSPSGGSDPSFSTDPSDMIDRSGGDSDATGGGANEQTGSTSPSSGGGGGGSGGDVSDRPTPDQLEEVASEGGDTATEDSADVGSDGGDSGGETQPTREPAIADDSPSQPEPSTDSQEPEAIGQDEPRQATVVEGGMADARNTISREQFQQLQSQTEFELSEDDVLINDGEVSLSAEAREQEAIQRREGLPEETQRRLRRGEVGASGETDLVAPGEDQRTVETEAGTISAGERPTGDAGGPDADVFSVAVGEFEEAAGLDVPGEGSVTNEARERDRQQDGEAFGGDSEVERQLAEAGDQFESSVVDPVAGLAGDAAASPGGAVASIITPAEATRTALRSQENFEEVADEASDDQSLAELQDTLSEVDRTELIETDTSAEQRRAATEGAVRGASEVVNVPRLLNTAIEGGEVVTEAGAAAGPGFVTNQFARTLGVETGRTFEETSATRSGERTAQAATAAVAGAGRTAEAASENPASVGGQLVGGAVAGALVPGSSASAVRGVSRVDLDTSGARATARQFMDDDRAMAGPPRQRTITRGREVEQTQRRELEREQQDLDDPPEAQLPPRREFPSDEAFEREVAAVRARDQLPPREEFPSEEAYSRELEMATERELGNDPFATRTREAEAEVESEATAATRQEQEATAAATTPAAATTATAGLFAPRTQDQDVAAAAAEPAEATTTGVDVAADAATATVPATTLFTETFTTAATGLTTATDIRTATATDTDTATTTDTTTATDTATVTRTDTATDTETALQTRFEFEPPSRRRLDDERRPGGGQDTRPDDGGQAGVGVVLNQFLNPLGGE